MIRNIDTANRCPSFRGRTAELVALLEDFPRWFALRSGPRRPAKSSLTMQEFRVFLAVGRERQWTVGGLARHMMLGISSLSSILDRLEAKRVVLRERSRDDRRVVPRDDHHRPVHAVGGADHLRLAGRAGGAPIGQE